MTGWENRGRRTPATKKRKWRVCARLKEAEWEKLSRLAAAYSTKDHRCSIPEAVIASVACVAGYVDGTTDGKAGQAWIRKAFKSSRAERPMSWKKNRGRSKHVQIPINVAEDVIITTVADGLECLPSEAIRFAVLHMYDVYEETGGLV